MAKHESTAINDLIHVTQGRLPEPGGPDPADGLFVTKPPPPAQFLPVASYFDPGALTTPVPLVSAPPPPLPRRRAPNATPPVVPIHHDDEDDDDETQIDPNVMAKFAASSPAPLPFAAPMPPRPILPHYAIPSPVPLPPAPAVASHARPTMVVNPVPYPSVSSPVSSPAPYIASAPSGYAVAGQGGVAHDTLETHRVAPLALADAASSRGELFSIAKKLALPFAGVVVVLVFITGYVIHRGQGRASRESAPVTMQASPPSVAVAAAAATAAAPVVTAIADSAPPTVSAMGDTIGWKPREVTPTLAAKVEVAAAAPASEEPAEIEMDAVPVVKQPRARRSSSSSKRPAPKQVAAAVPAPMAEKKPAKAEKKPVKAEKPAKVAKSAAAPVDDDPIAAAINAPTKSKGAKATGPGRVTITSTPAALIYVDGRSLNKMTPQTLTLPEGPHKITLLELSSRKAKTSEITVEAGGSAQIAKKF